MNGARFMGERFIRDDSLHQPSLPIRSVHHRCSNKPNHDRRRSRSHLRLYVGTSRCIRNRGSPTDDLPCRSLASRSMHRSFFDLALIDLNHPAAIERPNKSASAFVNQILAPMRRSIKPELVTLPAIAKPSVVDRVD